MTGLEVHIHGREVTVITEEGPKTMPLDEWLEALRVPRFESGDVRWPDGIVGYRALPRNGVVLVHQSSPMVRRLRWLAEDSPQPFGKEAVYRDVSLALPYVVTLIVFVRGRGRQLELTAHNEGFFRNAPLRSFDDTLHFPALLNCSRVPDIENKPLSWICVQHLSASTWASAQGDSARLRAGTAALLGHMYNTGFNRSSDVHELSSWYTETVKAGVDARLAHLDAWEQATRDEPTFVLDVPWLPTGHSLSSVLDRIDNRLGAGREVPATADDLARIVLGSHRRILGRTKNLFEGII